MLLHEKAATSGTMPLGFLFQRRACNYLASVVRHISSSAVEREDKTPCGKHVRKTTSADCPHDRFLANSATD